MKAIMDDFIIPATQGILLLIIIILFAFYVKVEKTGKKSNTKYRSDYNSSTQFS